MQTKGSHMKEKNYGEKLGEKNEVYRKQLKIENDRGSVIICAVILEDILKKMLESRLIPSLEKDDELFDSGYAPFNIFSAKIDLAYRVGLIRSHVRSSLHLIRKTRNDFAHSKLTNGFNEDSVRSRIHELFKLNRNILDLLWGAVARDPEFNTALEHKGIELTDPQKSIKSFVEVLDWRGTFDLLAAATCAGLDVASEDVDPIEKLTDSE